MKLDEDSREMVYAIERHGGTASTTVIRQETGMPNSSVRYRYRKLKRLGLITTEKDSSLTADGVAGVTVASLTDLAREEIDKGLTVEAEQERADITPADNHERIERASQGFDLLKAHIEVMSEVIAEMDDAPEKKEIFERGTERYTEKYEN